MRIEAARTDTAARLDTSGIRRPVEKVLKPKSLARGMRAAGIALVAIPDPVTDVPAAALLASSYLLRRREPAGLTDLAREARGLIRELQSLRL